MSSHYAFILHPHSSSCSVDLTAVVILRAMAAADLSRTTEPARTTKGLFLICSLLCLAYVTSSLKTKDQLEKMKTALEEAERQKAEEKYRNATITKLFDLASSLTNKDQMEIFKETLQTATEEEERLKEESKYKMRIASKQYNEKIKEIIPQLVEAMILSYDSPPLQEMVDIVFHMLEKTKTYLDKKLDLLQE